MEFPQVRPWVLAAAALATLSASHAVTTQNVNVCKPAGDASGLEYEIGRWTNVIWNRTFSLLCPVLRSQEVGGAGLSVWVDGWKDVYPQSPSCSLFSVSYTGQMLGWTSLTVGSPAGPFDVQLTLPQSQVPAWSYQTLSCNLPPYAELWDIEGAF